MYRRTSDWTSPSSPEDYASGARARVRALQSAFATTAAAGVLSVFVALLLFASFGPSTAYAQAPEPVLRIGDDLTVEAGETIDGSVTILGADLTIEAGGEVTGDVAVLVGNAAIDGRVGGNVTATGDLDFGDDAYVGGNVTALGGYDAGAATIVGTRLGRASSDPLGFGTTDPARSRSERLVGWLTGALMAIVVTGLLVALTAAVAPQGVGRVRHALRHRAGSTFAVGCLAWILFPLVFLALLLSAVGIVIVPIAYALLLLLGWTALAQAVGSRLVPAIGMVGAAIVGSTVLSLALAGLLFFSFAGFCLAVSVAFVLSLAPLGAALMTVWGTRTWPSSDLPSPTSPDPDSHGSEPAPPAPEPPDDSAPLADRPQLIPSYEPVDAYGTWSAPGAPEPSVAAAPPHAPHAPPPTEPTSLIPPSPAAPDTPPAPPSPSEPPSPAASILPTGSLPSAELTRVPGITPVYALLLRQAGLDDLHALAEADPARVAEIASAPGVISVSLSTAEAWVRSARSLVGSP